MTLKTRALYKILEIFVNHVPCIVYFNTRKYTNDEQSKIHDDTQKLREYTNKQNGYTKISKIVKLTPNFAVVKSLKI